MKYIAINELAHFQFHDAEIESIDFYDGCMMWKVGAVNATTANTQSKFEKDMCIKSAQITFEDIQIESIIFNGYQVYDHNRNLIESKEPITAKPSEYRGILRETLEGFCYIFSMQELPVIETNQYKVCFSIDGGAGMYDLTIGFSKSIVQWNEFDGEAWYEDEKWKKETKRTSTRSYGIAGSIFQKIKRSLRNKM